MEKRKSRCKGFGSEVCPMGLMGSDDDEEDYGTACTAPYRRSTTRRARRGRAPGLCGLRLQGVQTQAATCEGPRRALHFCTWLVILPPNFVAETPCLHSPTVRRTRSLARSRSMTSTASSSSSTPPLVVVPSSNLHHLFPSRHRSKVLTDTTSIRLRLSQ